MTGEHRGPPPMLFDGYAFDLEENEDRIRCVAAPVRDVTAAIIGAISVSGPVTRVGREQVGALAGAVIQAAKAISSAMGFSQEQATLETPRRLHSVGP